MLAPISNSDTRLSASTQACRADEFVAKVNSAIAHESLRQQWDVPLDVDPNNGTDVGAARWAQQRFNNEEVGYRAELSEKGRWILRVTKWDPF